MNGSYDPKANGLHNGTRIDRLARRSMSRSGSRVLLVGEPFYLGGMEAGENGTRIEFRDHLVDAEFRQRD